MTMTAEDVSRFERSRRRLEAIAYRLLGSASEAEDAVQETFLRWQAADVERIEVPEAWLTKVLTNLCLNQLASARVRRRYYTAAWRMRGARFSSGGGGSTSTAPAPSAIARARRDRRA